MPTATEIEKHVAVIFTALPVEYNAVRSHVKYIEEKVHPQGTIYEQGIFSSNGQSWDVGIAEIGEGNEQAALEVERAVQYFNPNIILFVGVAGGIKDVKLGDVVVATKVYGYESGKAGETFRPRPEVGSPNYKLISRARAEARKDDWLKRLSEVTDPNPNVFVKPIAAGNKVISSTRSTIYEFIKSYYEDTLAVEMEGYGFLKAAYANPDVYALIIRGISDLIDGKEAADKGGSQKLASLHASAFAFEVLAKSYIESIDFEERKHSEKVPTERIVDLDNKKEKFEISNISTEHNHLIIGSNADTMIYSHIAEYPKEKTTSLDKSIQQNAEIYKSLENYDSSEKFISPSTGMEFVLIPAGKFKMGTSQRPGSFGYIRDVLKNVEFPAHEVTIKDGFYLGKYPVTQRQWITVMDENPSKYKGDNLPVESISWNDTQEFIKKLNEMEKIYKYRLPTEAEWEYACRAGTKTEYSFGDDVSRLNEYACRHESVFKAGTCPVGQKKPNEWGLYDMHGNVWEWVQDSWHNNYKDAPSDNQSWEDRHSAYRVTRGGGWADIAILCRSAHRHKNDCGQCEAYIGFRLLREITPIQIPKVSATSDDNEKKINFSDSKKEELIGYTKQYYGAKEVKVTFIPSANGSLIVDYCIDAIPTKTGLNNNIANLIILSKALARESGITNPDVSVCATYMDGQALGIGNYYSSSGETNIDITGEENLYLNGHSKYMPEKYDRNKVENSFTKFDDLVSDLMDSEYSTFDSNLRTFLDHCENDEIMSIVCDQLKYDDTILERWWSENSLNTPVPHVGSRKLNPPIDNNQKDALYYQLCLKMSQDEDELFGFCLNYTNCSPREAIVYFNKNIVSPLVRSIRRKLNEIKSKGYTEQGDNRFILKQEFYVYQDFSTTVNGDVNIKGDAAIGEGAKIEKKSLI